MSFSSRSEYEHRCSSALSPQWAGSVFGLLVLFALQRPCIAQTRIESPPFEYSETDDNNLVTDLITKLKTGETTLEYDRDHGYLKSLLAELSIPVSSQALVFSKTSMQISYISPRSPRAIYFSDDVYVGWVRGSPLMEISTSDPKLGAAFYTVQMTPRAAVIKREFYDCLACHASTLTQGVPGHTVRSVIPKPDGTIDIQRRSFVTDHTSPIAERWGGWYVTGKHGEMQHMGNAFLRGNHFMTEGNANRPNLRGDFLTSGWLSPYSDIIALMVLEHQVQMHNTFTHANFKVRQALYDIDKAYRLRNSDPRPVPPDAKRELQITIKQAAKKVVDYMLFVNEAPLTSKVEASSQFSREFAQRGPRDQNGRSLREFNLQSRLFRYPCSYLIYSPAFDALECSLREQIYLQLWKILATDDATDEYAHLSEDLRASILSILRETKDQLPDYWTTTDASSPR